MGKWTPKQTKNKQTTIHHRIRPMITSKAIIPICLMESELTNVWKYAAWNFLVTLNILRNTTSILFAYKARIISLQFAIFCFIRGLFLYKSCCRYPYTVVLVGIIWWHYTCDNYTDVPSGNSPKICLLIFELFHWNIVSEKNMDGIVDK